MVRRHGGRSENIRKNINISKNPRRSLKKKKANGSVEIFEEIKN